MNNQGSFLYPTFSGMILYYLLVMGLHRLAIQFYQTWCCRRLGTKLSFFDTNIRGFIIGCFFEGFLGLTLCVALQFYQMSINHLDMRELFFTTPSDIIQSILSIMTALALVWIVLIQFYVQARYSRNLALNKEVIERDYEVLFGELRFTFYGTCCNIVMTLFRLCTILILILLSDHPMIQLMLIGLIV